MRSVVAAITLGMLGFCVTAQDNSPDEFELTLFGESGFTVAENAAAATKLKLTTPFIDEWDLDARCWIQCRGKSRQELAEILSLALGHPVVVDETAARLYISPPDVPAPAGSVKGYDVSVAAGAFVEYVNGYGSPRKQALEADKPEPEQTAAEHLAELLHDLLYEPDGASCEYSVVGDRILFTIEPRRHTRVREALDLVMSEAGGESAHLKDERAVVAKLRQAKFETEMLETPVGSVVTAICRAADLGVVLGPLFAESAVQEHIDFSAEPGTTAWDAMQALFHQLEENDWSFDVTSRCGVVAIENTFSDVQLGFRVYNVSELLKKLHASYQRQRTAPGRDQGFEGDLRSAGGIDVILDALDTQLRAAGRDSGAQVYSYGTRIIVRGGHASVDSATAILKEMGWEAPKD